MVAGERFDLGNAKAKAAKAKKDAMIKNLISYGVMVIILIALAVGGKIGWDRYQEKKEQERLQAEAELKAAEKREKLAREKKEKERQEFQAKKEAEAKAKKEEAERRKREREEQRVQQQEARRQQREAEQERRRQEAENRRQQQENKRNGEQYMQSIRIDAADHYCVEAGMQKYVEFSVKEPRWAEIEMAIGTKNPTVFCAMLDPQKDEAAVGFPDAGRIAAAQAKLAEERFTFIVKQSAEVPKWAKLEVVRANVKTGVDLPESGQEFRDKEGRVDSWHCPFRYGDENPVFVMTGDTAKRLRREWADTVKSIQSEARKSRLTPEALKGKLRGAFALFASSIRGQLAVEPEDPAVIAKRRAEEEAKAKAAKKKSKQTFGGGKDKGGKSDIRTMSGPKDGGR